MKEYKVYNRMTGLPENEFSGNTGGLSFLYHTVTGRILSPVIARHFISKAYSRFVRSKRSIESIPSFIAQYNIDVSEVEKTVDKYRSLNDFFIRKLKPDARPIDQMPGHLISPADSRLFVFDLSVHNVFPVKGYWHSLAKFVKSNFLSKQYADGWCFVYRLAPCDYHRFCYIDDGRQEHVKRIKGKLHSVNPIALQSVNSLLSKNYRELTMLHTQNFGTVLHFEVGALMVGKVVLHHRNAVSYKRGQEKGWFEFGGSTIVQLFLRNAVKPDQDILDRSRKGMETLVRLGEKVGTKR